MCFFFFFPQRISLDLINYVQRRKVCKRIDHGLGFGSQINNAKATTLLSPYSPVVAFKIKVEITREEKNRFVVPL